MRDPGRNAMRSVKMNKSDLVEILHLNKDKHIKEYNESVVDYKQAAIKLAKQHMKLAKTEDLDQIKRIRAMPNPPSSYEDSYNRAIRMMELSVEDVIELEEDVFNQLVLDEWSWKHQFNTSASLYKSM